MRGPFYRAGWRRVICVASGPSLAEGDQKRNATTQTALTCFPRADLADTLARYAEPAPAVV